MNKTIKKSILHFSKSLKGFYILILFALSATHAFAQLDDLHYLPPLRQTNWNTNRPPTEAIVYQDVYLSTPSTSSFVVEIFRGTNPTPFTTRTISNNSPGVYTSDLNPNVNTNYDNILLVSPGNTGTVLSNAGLKFKSVNGEKFYVNYRGSSRNQGTSLTSKGRRALGTSFKWGGIPLNGTPLYNHANWDGPFYINATLGIMATEANTVVNLYDYNAGINFTNISSSTTQQITLNAGESFVFEVKQPITGSTNSNKKGTFTNGFLGASLVSNKPIAVSLGSLLMRTENNPTLNASASGWDAGIDQITPETAIGKEYVFVRGTGDNSSEYALIFGTKNGTNVYVGGDTSPYATIDNGDYVIVPGTKYSTTSVGGSMFINTDKNVYAYQVLCGGANLATSELSFISPVNCLMVNTIDNIPNVTSVANQTVVGGIVILATTNIADTAIHVTTGSGTSNGYNFTSVSGTGDWKTCVIMNVGGNVKVSASGPVAMSFFGSANGYFGAAGFFSGFDNLPNITVQTSGNGCLPSSVLTATAGYSSYSWFNSGVLIPGQTNNTFTPTLPGSYSVVVQVGTCTYESAPVTVVNCYPDIQLSNTANVSSGKVNDIITFTIKAKYLGNGTVTNLVVNNLIPSGLTYQSYSATYGTLSAGTATNKDWTIGTMYSGEEHILTVTTKVATVAAANAVTYTVSNTQNQTDGNTLPDDSTESILLYKNTLPVLSNFGAINKHRLDAPFTLIAPTSTSPGSFTYSSSNTAVATVSGSTVTIVGAGIAVITANQAASGSYDIGFITATLKVNAIEEVLTNFGKKTTDNSNSNAFISNSGSTLAQKVIAFGGKLVEVKSPTISAGSSLVVWVDSELKSSYNQLENMWYDLSGNFNNGALQNNFNYSTSNAKSFVFNGTNNDINFLKAHPASDNVTIETWMNAAAFSSGAIQTLFSHTIAGTGSLRLEFDNNKLRANLSNAYCFYDCPMTFTADKWYHIAVVYSKTGNAIQFYVNGALIHTVTVSSGPTILSSTFKLGSFNGTANYFNGKMGSFKMYTSARTAAEIVADFTSDKKRYGTLETTTASTGTSASSCYPISGLVMHLDAGNVASYSGSGTTWTDISGNGNHGTLINGVGFTSSNNGALVFDGTNDYVSTPIDADLQAMPSTSWSGWFKRTGTSSNWQCIFGMEDGGWDRALFIKANGYNLSMGASSEWQTGASASPSAWNHVVVIYDNGTMRFYLNGVEYTTGTSEGNHSSNGTFTIGANQTGGIRYGGIIAQVLVYDRALTTAEVQQIYNVDKTKYGL